MKRTYGFGWILTLATTVALVRIPRDVSTRGGKRSAWDRAYDAGFNLHSACAVAHVSDNPRAAYAKLFGEAFINSRLD